MSDWPTAFDPFAWVYADGPFRATLQRFNDEGIAYLLCETMDGQPLAWAPLGTGGKPFRDGEDGDWRIRTVMP